MPEFSSGLPAPKRWKEVFNRIHGLVLVTLHLPRTGISLGTTVAGSAVLGMVPKTPHGRQHWTK